MKGFTILEITIVLILATILFILTEPTLPTATVELRAQAEQLAGDIRYTQSISMHRGARYRINFFSTNYTITDLAGATSVPNPSNNASQKDMESGITLSVTGSIPNGFLAFDGKGAPYVDTGSTSLSGSGVITLTREGETQLISVSPETGAAVVGGGT